jgi:RimJ/RimL family protein N-acetyltransferase
MYRFDRARFEARFASPPAIPAGIGIERFEPSSPGMDALRKGLEELAEQDVSEGAFGFVARDGEKLVGCCYSETAPHRSIKGVQINTSEAWQRKGIASALAYAFAHFCLDRGQEPGWDCIVQNDESMAMAEKFGFEPDYDIVDYYVPVDGPIPADYWYGSARSLAMTGKLDDSMRSLRRAIAEGFDDDEALAEDDAIAPLRLRPDWESVTRKG